MIIDFSDDEIHIDLRFVDNHNVITLVNPKVMTSIIISKQVIEDLINKYLERNPKA